MPCASPSPSATHRSPGVAEPIVLSGSSLNTFLNCQRQWELAYVRRLKRPPGLKMARGIAAHAAAEIDLGHKLETGSNMPRDAVLDAFADSFKEVSVESPENPDKKETRGAYLDSGVGAVGYWYDEIGTATNPVHVEIHGQFTIKTDTHPEPMHYDWTADLVDEVPDGEPMLESFDDWVAWRKQSEDPDPALGWIGQRFAGGRRVRDWKFVSRTPDSAAAYVLNMVGYAIGLRRLLGGAEVGRQLDHIVLLKQPKYVPIADGPLTQEDIMGFTDIVEGAYKSIEAGVFPPTGLKSGACSWCGYADGTCTAYRRRR